MASESDKSRKPSFDSFSSLFVPYERVKSVDQALGRLLKYGAGDPVAGKAAKLLMLTGPARSGKTTLLNRFQQLYPTTTLGDADTRPIIVHGLIEKTSIKDLATGLLIKLGDGAPDKGTRAKRVERVAHHIREQRVRLIILDEGHHLIDSDSDKVIYSVSESIKSLLNLGLCPIVLSGMPDTEIVVDGNPQLQGRLFERCRLTGFDWKDLDERTTFRLILHRFDTETPLPKRASLGDPGMALRIWRATHGLVGLVAQLLESAVVDAIEEGAECLMQARLAAAFDKLHSRDAETNPFRKRSVSADDEPIKFGPAMKLGRKTGLAKGKRRNPEMPI